MDEESIFAAALKKNPEERAAFLDEACAGDSQLRESVESLLSAHDEASELLEALHVEVDITADSPPVQERAGMTVGNYKLLEEIGEGGFGIVFMAEQRQPLRRKVAFKVIKPGMDTREVVARFEVERQALAMMDHPNIAKVLDAGATDSGRPYFVMELVRGIPITEYCDQSNLNTSERLRLFATVCQAIQHAHQKGIIHRDIKPSNVMVTLHDGRPVPKVIDFGVAKAINQRLTEQTIFTRFAQIVGTPLYMSPEQAEMSGMDVDTRTDIYSLGVLLYELLTGTTPFDRERLQGAVYDEIRRIIRDEEPPKPSTKVSTLGEKASAVCNHRKTNPKKLSALIRGELDWIVMKALDKDRTRRYETATGFANDIQRYLDDEAVVACPPSAGYRFRKFARRNKAAIVTIAVVVAALVVGMIGTTWQAIRATQAERSAREEKQLTAEQRDRAIKAETEVSARLVAEQKAHDEAEKLRQQAEENAQQAEAERLRAEANLRLALEVLDEVYVQVTQKRLSGQRPSKAEKQSLLHTTLDFYERFASQNRQAPKQRSLVEEVYRRIIAAREELIERLPHLVGNRRAMATALVGLAALLEADGRGMEAEKTYGQAVDVQKTLVDDFPSVAEYRRELAAGHQSLVPLLESAGRSLDARQHRRDAEKLRDSFVSNDEVITTNSIRLADFSNATDLELLGDAELVDKRLRLAWAEPGKGGAAWLTAKQYVGFGFETTFTFQMSGGAAGLAFVIQNHLMSVGGGSMRYTMPNSLAVEFDTSVNSQVGDPKGTHISVQTNGTGTNSTSHSSSLGSMVSPFKLDDNHPHQVTIRYVPGALTVFLDEDADPILTAHVLLETTLDLDRGQAWIGFTGGTGGTGGAFQTHDILNWEYRAFEPPRRIADIFAESVEGQQELRGGGMNGDVSSTAGPSNEPAELNRENDESSPPEDYSAYLARASAFYGTIASQNTKDPAAQLEIGKAYWRMGDIQKQLGLQEEAEETYRLADEAWDKLRNDFRDASEAQHGLVDAYHWRAQIALNIQQHEQALALYAKILELAPSNAEAYCGRRHVYYNLGQFEDAIAEVSEAVELEPANAAYWNFRGLCYSKLGQPEKAKADYARAVELQPSDAILWQNRAVAHGKLGRHDESLEYFAKAINLNPSEPIIWRNRGAAFVGLKRWNEAVASYAKAIELNPTNALTLNTRGTLYLEQGEFANAIADYSKAVKHAPNEKIVWENRARAYASSGQYDEAVSDFSRAIELGANSSPSFYRRALAQLASGQMGEYRSGAGEMLDRFGQGEDPNAVDLTAWTCSLVPKAVSDWSQVVEAAEKAASGESKSAQHLGTLGAALYRAGRFEEAILCLMEADSLIGDADSAQQSSRAYTWFYLAMAHHGLGRVEESSQWMAKAVHWTDRVLDLHDRGPGAKLAWNRRLTLRLLRAQAESLLETTDGKAVDLAKVMERYCTEASGDVADESLHQVRETYLQFRLGCWLAEEGRSDEADGRFRQALSTFQNLSDDSRLSMASRLPGCGEAVVLPLPDLPKVSYATLTTRHHPVRLSPDASQTKDFQQTFYQTLALHQFKSRLEILDPAWELTRTVFLRGCRAAHYNPRDGRLYVGTRLTASDGLYAIDADGRITRIADADRIAAVAVHPEKGHVFVSEDFGGKIYRTAFGTTGRETWVSEFKATDSDPMGMAFATQGYVGKLLATNEGLVVDQGYYGRDEVYRFSATAPDQKFLLHSDGENKGPLVCPWDVTIGAAGIFILDTLASEPGRIYRLGDDWLLTPMHTNEPIAMPTGIATDPNTGDLFIGDAGGKRLLRVNPDTGATSQIITGLSLSWPPACVDVTPDGKQVFVTDGGSHAIFTFTVRTEADYAHAIEQDPDDPIHWVDRARFSAFRGDLEQALADFNRAVELGPDDSVTWMSRAYFHADRDQPQQALADINRAIEVAPNDWRVWRARGEVHDKLNQWDKAIADYRRAIDLKPEEWPFWKTRAEQFAQSKLWDKAVAVYSKLIELKPNEPQLRTGRASAHVQLRRWDKAIDDCTLALRSDPNSTPALLNRAIAHRFSGHHYEALQDANMGLRIAPDHVELLSERAMACFHLDQWDQAIEAQGKVIKLRPLNAALALTGAQLLLLADRTEDYQEACATILHKFGQTEHPGAMAEAARACLMSPIGVSDPTVPLELAKRAVAVQPKWNWVHHVLGMAHLRAGQFQEATAQFHESLELSPEWAVDRPLSWFGLAMVHHQSGETDKARQWYDMAVDWLTTHPRAGEHWFHLRLDLRIRRREAERLLGIQQAGHGVPQPAVVEPKPAESDVEAADPKKAGNAP